MLKYRFADKTQVKESDLPVSNVTRNRCVSD